MSLIKGIHHVALKCCSKEEFEKTKQFVSNFATGATMPSINTKFMGEIPIRVPSLDAQNKIASILWMIDDKIELNKKINKNLAA